LAEVFRLGTAKAEENLAFRRYLCAHHYADTPFQMLASQLQRHVDCTACANCCRHSVVSVNRPEIEDIAWHLGTTPEAVIRHYTVPIRGTRLTNPAEFGEGCVFLDSNLCMIYEARPKACATSPRSRRHPLARRPPIVARPLGRPLSDNLQRVRSYKHLTGHHLHPGAHERAGGALHPGAVGECSEALLDPMSSTQNECRRASFLLSGALGPIQRIGPVKYERGGVRKCAILVHRKVGQPRCILVTGWAPMSKHCPGRSIPPGRA